MDVKRKISDFNCEIRSHFYYKKRFTVRKGILPGNSKSLLQAVKIAKNRSHPSIPNNMTIGGELVNGHEIAEHFAVFFDKKVVTIVSETIINPMVNKR